MVEGASILQHIWFVCLCTFRRHTSPTRTQRKSSLCAKVAPCGPLICSLIYPHRQCLSNRWTVGLSAGTMCATDFRSGWWCTATGVGISDLLLGISLHLMKGSKRRLTHLFMDATWKPPAFLPDKSTSPPQALSEKEELWQWPFALVVHLVSLLSLPVWIYSEQTRFWGRPNWQTFPANLSTLRVDSGRHVVFVFVLPAILWSRGWNRECLRASWNMRA